MLYSTIKDPSFLFEDLKAETVYDFKLRAVNKNGVSGWSEFSAKTKIDPLSFAITGVNAETTAMDQRGQKISKLFDFDENIYEEKIK